jgi:hypothetical protein
MGQTKKHDLIAKYLETPGGIERLAESMTQPSRCGGWDYSPESVKKRDLQAKKKQEDLT